MKENEFKDLKQFIDGRISQSEVTLRTDIDIIGTLRTDIVGTLCFEIAESEVSLRNEIVKAKTELSRQMTEGFAGVGDALEIVFAQHR